ncbi:MAG: hypothetical protein WD872_16570 [Pirellulaceae bacterium]
MDQTALVSEERDAAEEFLTAFEKEVRVVFAFWAKSYESEQWSFYIALDALDERDFAFSYGIVLRIASALKDADFDPFRVRLLHLQSPLVKAVADAYRSHAAKLPVHVRDSRVAKIGIEELQLVRGPKGDYVMPTGREALHHIIDKEAEFFQTNGAAPKKMKLPVLMAYDLAKCGREELGELSGRIFKDGIAVLEREGFHGMDVEIVRDRNATLQFE